MTHSHDPDHTPHEGEHDARGQLRTQDCEELVSDVFVALWRSAARLQVDSRLKPWLAVVARNRALNWARERSRRVATVPLDLDASLPSDVEKAVSLDATRGVRMTEETGTPEMLETLARDSLVFEALGTLDEQSRHLVEGYYFEDRSIRELANTSGCSESMIKSRLFRSRKLLKRYLQQEGI